MGLQPSRRQTRSDPKATSGQPQGKNNITKSTVPPSDGIGDRVLSDITTTMTEAKDPHTIVTAMEEADKKSLNLISNAKEQDGKDKTLTNATSERKEAPNQATIAKNGNRGERS